MLTCKDTELSIWSIAWLCISSALLTYYVMIISNVSCHNWGSETLLKWHISEIFGRFCWPIFFHLETGHNPRSVNLSSNGRRMIYARLMAFRTGVSVDWRRLVAVGRSWYCPSVGTDGEGKHVSSRAITIRQWVTGSGRLYDTIRLKAGLFPEAQWTYQDTAEWTQCFYTKERPNLLHFDPRPSGGLSQFRHGWRRGGHMLPSLLTWRPRGL